MTLEQSIDLAELQADMAFEAYLAAFDEDAHPQNLDSLETEARRRVRLEHKFWKLFRPGCPASMRTGPVPCRAATRGLDGGRCQQKDTAHKT